MTEFISDDFIWDEIYPRLSIKAGTQYKRFRQFCCPMCIHRNESPDRRHRGGITRNDGRYIGIHCFNCGFKAKYQVGYPLSGHMKEFMSSIGIEYTDILRLSHKAWTICKEIQDNPELYEQMVYLPSFFPMVSLPDKSKTITQLACENCTDDKFLQAIDYIYSRGSIIAEATDYHWSPTLPNRIIIPFRHDNKIVGWTARSTDGSKGMRYYSSEPPDFLFNNHVLQKDRKFAIVTDGVIDALAIDGVAAMGSNLNDQQVGWLKNSMKQIIILPDNDVAGQRMIDIALQNEWAVAFPRLAEGYGSNNWWDSDVKDAADAVKQYGRLYTLKSIIDSSSNDKLKINILRQLIIAK